MNDDYAIQKLFIGCAAAVLCVLILTLGSCTANRNALIAKSSDPLATACAINGGTYQSAECAALMVRGK